MISDILFLCLVLICLYLIFITLKKKNILNFDKFLNFKDKVENIYKNKNKNKNVEQINNNNKLINKVIKFSKIKSNEIIKSSKRTSSSYKKSISNIAYSINKNNYITEDTENLIDEVINQENYNNVVLVN